MSESQRPDIPGAIGSALAIVIGAASFWVAADFSPLGSVFPRSVGLLLMALGVVYIVLVVLGRTRRGAALDGSMLRRSMVAAVMLGWGFALGPIGFLPSSAVAMALLAAIANHDRWTPRTVVLFGGATGAVLLALYSLFKHALLVPLP